MSGTLVGNRNLGMKITELLPLGISQSLGEEREKKRVQFMNIILKV